MLQGFSDMLTEDDEKEDIVVFVPKGKNAESYKDIAKAVSYTHLIASGASSVTTGMRLTEVRSENLSLIRRPFCLISAAQFRCV